MKSLHLTDENGKPSLREQESPRPKPGSGEILVKIRAAGITPTEIGWYPTSHTRNGETRTNPVPSHEFSGEIVECGDGTKQFSIGQEVYGMNDWFADGALADTALRDPNGSRLSRCPSATLRPHRFQLEH
jgi:NADPH:quinone reductase-like Zn-dependent oxidoreductase